jgi:hypothetical protein
MDNFDRFGTFMESLRVILQAVIYGRLWIFMDMHVMDVYGHLRTFSETFKDF